MKAEEHRQNETIKLNKENFLGTSFYLRNRRKILNGFMGTKMF